MTKHQIDAQLRDIADEVMDLEFSLSEKRRQRDEMIVAARASGMSLRAIGEACMVSHQTVQNIVERSPGFIANRDTGDEQPAA
jgi:DNA-binding NarL/FixJ family response regulator